MSNGDQTDNVTVIYNRMMEVDWLRDFHWDKQGRGFLLDFSDEGRRASKMLRKLFSEVGLKAVNKKRHEISELIDFIFQLVHHRGTPRGDLHEHHIRTGQASRDDLTWLYTRMKEVNWLIDFRPGIAGSSPMPEFSPEGQNANQLLRNLFNDPESDPFDDEAFLGGFISFLYAMIASPVDP